MRVRLVGKHRLGEAILEDGTPGTIIDYRMADPVAMPDGRELDLYSTAIVAFDPADEVSLGLVASVKFTELERVEP